MEKLNTSNVQNTVKSGFEKNVNYYKQQIQENYMIQLNYKKLTTTELNGDKQIKK